MTSATYPRKGANQAVAMAKLGADVEILGCVGGDEAKKPHKEHGRHGDGNHPHQSGSRSEHRFGGLITVGDHDNTIVGGGRSQ